MLYYEIFDHCYVSEMHWKWLDLIAEFIVKLHLKFTYIFLKQGWCTVVSFIVDGIDFCGCSNVSDLRMVNLWTMDLALKFLLLNLVIWFLRSTQKTNSTWIGGHQILMNLQYKTNWFLCLCIICPSTDIFVLISEMYNNPDMLFYQ